MVFIATKDSSFDPSNAQDINTKQIAAQRSTISSQWLESNYPKASIKMYDTLNNAFLDLESNRVDAMISDKLPALEWLSKNNTDFEIKGSDIEIAGFLHHFRNSYLTMSCMDDLDHKYIENFRR